MSTTDLYLQTSDLHPEPIPVGQALLPSIMHANLQFLPIEVVEIVASNLQRPELCSLRLVCRDLYKKSLGAFARLHNAVKTDLSAQSLQKLVEMSNSAYLAPYIRTLHFRADKEGYLGRGFEWSRNTSGGLMDPLTGASSMLQDILRTILMNCRSFQIHNNDEIGMPKQSAWLTPDDVVSIVYFIVVNANLQIKSLTIGSQDETPGRLRTERLLPLCLHREKENREGLSSWRSLDSLILRINLTVEQYDWALNLLKEAPAVRHISLRLDFGNDYTFFRRLAALGPFHVIQNLLLDCITLDGTALSRFLVQHGKTLRGLTLRFIQLTPDSVKEEAGMAWKTVFGNMIGHMNRLEQVSVLFLFVPHNQVGSRARIFFSSLPADDSYPKVPGSEERTIAYDRVSADARMVATLESPIQLRFRFYGGKLRTVGASYEGRQIDWFLALLVSGTEVYFERL